MTSWKIERLEKLCTIHTGGTPSRQNPEYFLGNIPWITTVALGPLHIDEKKAAAFLTDEAVQGSAAKIIPPSSLLVGIRVGVGKTSINDCEIATNQDIAALTNIDDRCDIDYLQRVLRNYRSYFDLIKRGATIQGITTEVLRQLDIPLPPIETQRKIAAVLDTAQGMIDLRKAQLEKMDEFLRSVFLDMFGDPMTNPKDWNTLLVGNLIKVLEAGWSADGARRMKVSGEKAVLKVSAVTSGFFRDTEYKVLDENVVIKEDVFPHKGDLLFSRANTRELVGATCMIFNDYPDLLLSDKLWRITFNDLTNFVYMKFVLSDNQIRKSISNEATGTSGSMYNVSMEKFKALDIPLPPLHLQTRFAAIVKATEAQKALMQQSLTEMENNFNSLMQQAFRGELF